MTGKRISEQQVKVMAIFTDDPEGWLDSSAIERKTGLPGSTVRHFLFTLFRLGLLDRVETHGGYRYRLSPEAKKQPYYERLQEAAAAMKP
jgi:DNA-binding IclR family transcriptional regulator